MPDKKRIAFLCHPYHRGGVTRWMADAAVAAANSGYEVYFVTVNPVKEFHTSGGRETMVSLLYPYRGLIHILSPDAGYEFEFGTEAYRAGVYSAYIMQNVPDCPIIVSDDMSAWAAAASIADVYPMVGVLHGDQDYYYGRAQKYHEQLSVSVCVSGRVMRNLLEKCPAIDKNKVHVIPCGINLPRLQPNVKSDGVTRLTFIGRLSDYEKRAYDLVSICAALHKDGFSFHLDIVGNSEESRIEFTENFRKNGVEGFVTFHGWQQQDEIQKLLNKADILLLTSNSEGMPLVMMEALASGCGFTGTRVSGIEDYEHDARAADCVSVYTVGDIADAVVKIKRIAAVPIEQRQAAALRLAEDEFSMQVCLERYSKALFSAHTYTITRKEIDLSTGGKLYSRLIAVARSWKVKSKK